MKVKSKTLLEMHTWWTKGRKEEETYRKGFGSDETLKKIVILQLFEEYVY